MIDAFRNIVDFKNNKKCFTPGRVRMKHRSKNVFALKPVTKVVSAALLSIAASQSSAANFTLGDFEISLDSTFSYGASWRTEDRDWANTIGKANNLQNGLDFSSFKVGANPVDFQTGIFALANHLATDNKYNYWAGQGTYSTNGDAGNLNYDSGEMFSSIFKGTHELDIRKDNIGLFIRGMYFYDAAMEDDDRPWANPISGKEYDVCRDDDAAELVCSDVRLLDAFFYGDFDIGEMPFSVRVGQQVISWGESTLISHGISELNPVDISRLRAPGSELKEAFIPFGAVWASLGVTDNFNIEMFYQYQWEKTRLPAPGSYFSTNDFAGNGGHFNNVQLGFSGNPDIDLDTMLSYIDQVGIIAQGDMATAAGLYALLPTVATLKAPGEKGEIEPDDGGQYGLRLSWYLPELNDTELSFYYMNYHSRRPVFSGVTADFRLYEDDAGTVPGALLRDVSRIAGGEINSSNYHTLESFSKVELDYVEDIQLIATSFNTTWGETSIAGEVSYRIDEPLQIDDVELLYAAMPEQLAHPNTISTIYNPALDGISQMPDYEPGERAAGYILSDTVQAQATFTHLFGPTLGASQLTGLVEVGGINIRDMPNDSNLRLNGPATDRNGGIEGKEGLEYALQGGRETNPFPDSFAWGYRALAKLDYADVFAGINMSPRIVFSHDVDGTTPDPLFLFVEERKSVSLGVSFDYLSKWKADVTYNSFFDGVGTTNQMEDRDFVSFSISYSL